MPNALLARYFQARGLFGDLDFSAMKETQPDELFAAWLYLPDGQRNEMDAEFRDIFELSCEKGFRAIIDEAEAKKAPLVEIIPGKGSGQLKKHVLRFLEQKEIKAKYHRVEKDSKNFGRLFVHFRW